MLTSDTPPLPQRPRPILSGTLLVWIAALGFGAVSTFTQIALDRGTTLWAILFWRFVISGGVMGLYVAARQHPALRWTDAWRWIVLGGGGQALLLALALSSLRYISAATLAFLFYTYPMWVAIVQALRGAERLTPSRVLALTLSFAGAVLVAGRPVAAAGAWTGIALALGAAAVYAVYIPLLEWMQRDLPVTQTNAYAKAGSALVFLLLGVITNTPLLPSQPAAWAAITGLAVFSTLVPTVCFVMGLMRLGPVRTAITATVEPFLTALLAALVLHQPLSGHTALGGALIVSAVVWLHLRR